MELISNQQVRPYNLRKSKIEVTRIPEELRADNYQKGSEIQDLKRKKNAALSSTQIVESETEDEDGNESQIYEPKNKITLRQKS